MNADILASDIHKLLIIDDEVEITKALTRQFRKQYQVFSATSAEEGFIILEQENIQVVLSDQRMPGMSGVEFFARIKTKYPDALKLLLTGYSDIEAIISAINDGQVFRYVTKPWIPEELDGIIREAFEKYELITKNRKLMRSLHEANQTLEEKVKLRTRELEKANSKLSELNMEKNKYIGMVAHDLRNPIGVAASFSDILIDGLDILTNEEKMEYLGYINKNCYFALNLMHDFLDISKIEAGIFELNIRHQDFIPVMEECMNQLSLNAKVKSQEISIQCDQTSILACFDKDKIQQVLGNLLGNAIKFSDFKTNIVIHITENEDEIVTSVEDQGPGIPENELPEIFKSFKTTSVKSTNNEMSTGLGLAIVKKIVEAHQGSIQVKSTVGQGSVFTFTIPKRCGEVPLFV